LRETSCFGKTVPMLLILASVVACGTSKPTSFYLLSPVAGQDAGPGPSSQDRCLTVGVGPIELPDYLDRPQIVTQEGENRIHLAEFHQWAEPLGKTISRVLEENLSKLLCVQQAVFFPQRGSTGVDYRVRVNVIRFLGQSDGSVSLVAQWSVLEGQDDKLVAAKRSTFHRPGKGQGYAALAAAESNALGDLSREIADAILKAEQEHFH
jgi:uncharacterized lipoprotein YmbA